MLKSKSIDNLMPYVRYLAQRLIAESAKQGIPVKITNTMRDAEYQASIGGSNPAQIGPHAFGLAFDVCINSKTDAYNTVLLSKVGAIGKKLGLEWGGSWKKVDMPHFQYVQKLSDADLRAGKRKELPAVPAEPAPEQTPVTIKVGAKAYKGFSINGITYAPVRDVAEAVGKTVGWDKNKPGEVVIK